MKRPGRFPVCAGGALLLGVLAAAGCGSRTEGPFAARPGEAVNVIVEWDAEANKVVVSNPTIYLRVGKDWAQWVSPDGEVDVDFASKGSSPFDQAPKHVKKVLRSKAPKGGTDGTAYGYKVILKLSSDGTTHELDPRIEVIK